MYRFSLLKEASLWKHFVFTCLALVVRFDGTPMKLDTGRSMIQKEEITIRLLKGVDANGKVMPLIRFRILQIKLQPTLNQLMYYQWRLVVILIPHL